MSFFGKKVAVVGLAVNNTPLIKYLAREGAVVTVMDRKTPDELAEFLRELADLQSRCDIQYQLGPGYLKHLSEQEIVFLSPGIPKNLPEIQEAKKAGVRFSSELQLFFSLNHAPVIGVTGSSGKTTTTSLLGEMLTGVYPTKIGGNIGRPPLSFLSELSAGSWVVLELSSFQLQDLGYSPHIAIVTNITPNHLDIHSSMEEYIAAKSEALLYQNYNDVAVLNWDNEITRNLGRLVKGECYYFSRQSPLEYGAYVKEDRLYLSLCTQGSRGGEELICERSDLTLPGEHNVENVLAAALAARLAGVPMKAITKVIREFKGVEHRLEFVRELNGVRFINDSISTTPTRAIAGLLAMKAPVILIAGGYDKRLPFEEFAEVAAEKCRVVYLLGATTEQIEEAFNRLRLTRKASKNFPVIKRVSDLEEAVYAAKSLALPGDVVLLSPACASYDMFRSFEERGRLFKKLVLELQP
ncbi:MAG TPA: UDP-N-acetylmuramoyl-L-alanine--D-glutamate ligase [Firmicutes bacterium]|nr:UDP-N-acetylmuramoyl-L-alanine--D-glutamate ligase [Bacillota bacterium]